MLTQPSSFVTLHRVDFEAAFESMPGSFIILRPDAPDYTILAVSNELLLITAKERQDIIGRSIFEVYPENPGAITSTGPSSLKIALENATTQKKPEQMAVTRYDVANASGIFQERYWSTNCKPVLDAKGEVSFIILSAVDFTEQTKSEKKQAALRKIEKTYNLFMHAPVAVCIVTGPENIVELANEEILRFLGRTSDIVGKPLFEALPEATNQGFPEILDKVRKTGETFYAIEYPTTLVIDGKEELRYYNFVYQPYYENGSDKTASGIFSVAHDVTEQVLARKKIEEVKEQLNFRNALYEAQNDVTPDGILIVDAKGRILLHNKRFVEIWKMPQEIIDSNDDHAALDHAKTQLKDPDAFIDRVNYLYARQNDQSDEQILFKDGRIIERKGTPIVAKNGSYYGWAWYFRDVTDRLRQEQKFRNLVEQAAQPILILKGDELVLEVANEALFKLWKVGPDALNKPFLELLPEMKGQVFVDLLHNVMKTGEPFYGFETPAIFKRKDSMEETVYFNFSCQPYRERDGSITGVLVLATDVTEQVATKRQLIESEIRFRNIMQQAPVAFTLTRGQEVVIESVNPPMLKMIGKEKEEDVLGKAMVDVLPEVKDQRFLAIAKNVFSTGEPFRGNEVPVTLRIDGKLKERFFNVSYTPLVEDRKVTGVLHVAIDVTEQVAARKKIQEAEERARLAIESAELGTYEINLQNNVAIMSPRMASIFDVEDSADWNRYITAIHPEDLKLREEAYQKAYKNGVLDYQVRLVRKDGSMRWTRVKGKIYFDHENTPIRLLGVVQDITEQKEFSEALSKKVEERTRELAQANQHLASMNKELEQFTYAASHDMQEPLRKVQTFSSFLLQHHSAQLDDRGKNYLKKIDSSVNRMKVIIDDLLNYSHQTREAQQFVQTDLNKIIEQIEADLELVILQKNATIQKDILPEIAAVPSQMNQLFYNLFSNALKFSKPDVPVKIEIRVESPSNEEISKKGLSAQRSYLKINFTDNGIGFAQEYAEQIFSLFKRLHGRTEYEGTGIGLGLCKKIVQNHSGAIWAESASQEGAVFHILLPL